MKEPVAKNWNGQQWRRTLKVNLWPPCVHLASMSIHACTTITTRHPPPPTPHSFSSYKDVRLFFNLMKMPVFNYSYFPCFNFKKQISKTTGVRGEEGKATEAAYSQTWKQMVGSTCILVQREEGTKKAGASSHPWGQAVSGQKEGLGRSGSHSASFLPQSPSTGPFGTGALYMLVLTGLLKAVVTADPYPP